MRGPRFDLKTIISDRMASGNSMVVWTPQNFLDLGPREAVECRINEALS